MVAAKNPISFPEPELKDEFQPFLANEARPQEVVAPPAEAKPSEGNAFHLEKEFVSLFLKEPLIQKLIDEQVRERLEDRFQALRQQVTEEARLEGIAQGKEEALAEARIFQEKWREENALKLNSVLQGVLKEKETFLKAHEKEWSAALVHLLRRFKIPLAKRLGDGIESWLRDSLEQFSEQKNIQIYLSDSDYESLHASLEPKSPDRWQWMCDPNLSKNQVRYEVAGGGVFFDGSKEFQKLEAWLNEVSQDIVPGEPKDGA